MKLALNYRNNKSRRIKPKYKNTISCPLCGSQKWDYCSYTDEIWGSIYTVEQHGYCDSCGYVMEMCYSPIHEAFRDITKGFKNYKGEYYPKDIRKHKRNRRKIKLNIKGIEINPVWVFYV